MSPIENIIENLAIIDLGSKRTILSLRNNLKEFLEAQEENFIENQEILGTEAVDLLELENTREIVNTLVNTLEQIIKNKFSS